MKKYGFLSAPVAEIIATMGHTDRLIVCDAGFPVPPGVRRIDLAVERFVLAAETAQTSPRRYAEILDLLPGVPHDTVAHADFKLLARDARAVIRTGDFVPYSNILLVSGVIYP